MSANRWRLDGQMALVTGASVGIGRAVAAELLGLGADVLLVARDGAQLEATQLELEEQFPDADVRAFPADIMAAVKRLESLERPESQQDLSTGEGRRT